MIQLNEGGSAVGGERIKKENIQPTVARFNKEVLRVISPHKWGLVGSTGKKPENGDVDIGIETQLSFKEISEILSSLNLHHVVNTGLGEISVAFPQYDSQGNQLPDIVQIDLMIGDFAWIDFIYTGFSPQETKYKPLARTAVLYGLLRYSSEKQDGDIITFYSISPNRGAFLKQGKKVVNKKGVKELKSDRVGEYIQDPHFIVETISEGTRHTWTLEELRYPFEELWPLVKDRCPEEMVEKISKYAKNFLENIKIPVPEELINIESLMEAAKTAHLTHIEDKLYDEGKMGGEKILMYLESLFDELKGNTPKNKVRATLKVDGSPAVCISNNYPGINKPFVGTKNTFAKSPQIYFTEEEIVAKYGEIPDLVEKLSAALRLIPQLGLPDGEIWKGDFLFTKKDLVIEEMDGKQYVAFQPNTLIYALPLNSEIGQKVLSCDIGIAFHTKYTGNNLQEAEATADFNVDVSNLTPLPNAFIIDANLPSIAGSGTLTQEESQVIDDLLKSAYRLFDALPDTFFEILQNDSAYVPLLNMYENYMVRIAREQETQFGENVHEYLMKFTDWIHDKYTKEAETKKTEKGKSQTLARADAIISFIDQNISNFISLFELQNSIVKIKNLLLKKMEQVSKLVPLKRDEAGNLKITNNEGFAISDIDGDIIKVVDRLGFSQANLLRTREVAKMQNKVSLEEKGKSLESFEMTPEALEKLLQDEDLNIRQKTSSRHWKVVSPGNVKDRAVRIRQFLKDYPEAVVQPGTERNILFRGYVLEFKPTLYAGRGGQEFETMLSETALDPSSILHQILEKALPKKHLSIDDIERVEPCGAKNTKRAVRWDLLYSDDPTLVSLPEGVNPGEFKKIGEALADIRIWFKNGASIPISVKSSPKVTFINSGLTKRGTDWEENIKRVLFSLGMPKKIIMQALDGFRDMTIRRKDKLNSKIKSLMGEKTVVLYDRESLQERKEASEIGVLRDVKLNQERLELFLENAIGGDYLMVHDNHGYWVSSAVRELMARNPIITKIQLPISRDRLDIYMKSEGLKEIIINIRPKHATVFVPGYIMCDYVEDLDAINKVSRVYTVEGK